MTSMPLSPPPPRRWKRPGGILRNRQPPRRAAALLLLICLALAPLGSALAAGLEMGDCCAGGCSGGCCLLESVWNEDRPRPRPRQPTLSAAGSCPQDCCGPTSPRPAGLALASRSPGSIVPATGGDLHAGTDGPPGTSRSWQPASPRAPPALGGSSCSERSSTALGPPTWK